MKRFGQVIAVKPEKLADYVYWHQNPWPEINAMIKDCNIQNYSIYHHNGLLFAYFEYVGEDFEADMQRMADDPKTQAWWALVKPFQNPLPERPQGAWWTDMSEVYHLD